MIVALGLLTGLSSVSNADNDELSKAINTVVERRDGTIWCGTRQGLFYVDPGSGRVELRAVDIGAPKGPGLNYINSILEDRYGTMWIGTRIGLYRHWPELAYQTGLHTNTAWKRMLLDENLLFADHVSSRPLGSTQRLRGKCYLARLK